MLSTSTSLLEASHLVPRTTSLLSSLTRKLSEVRATNGSQLIPLAIQVLVINDFCTYRALPTKLYKRENGIQPADSANMSHVNLVVRNKRSPPIGTRWSGGTSCGGNTAAISGPPLPRMDPPRGIMRMTICPATRQLVCVGLQ